MAVVVVGQSRRRRCDMCTRNETADDEAQRVGALEERVPDEQQEELVVEDADCRVAGGFSDRGGEEDRFRIAVSQ